MDRLIPRKRSSNVLTDLTENFDRFLSSFQNFPELETYQLSANSWTPRIDVKEKNNQYIIYTDVPGIEPDKININFDNGILTIKGEKETEQKEEDENYLRVERSSGSFLRQMSFPGAIDAQNIKAKSKNGVLIITLPKAQKGASNKIQVEK